jgi:hypothetical protein
MEKAKTTQPASSQWAGNKAAAAPGALPAPPSTQPPAGYTRVTLKKAVTVEGHLYRPGQIHVVNAAILAAMGDAVDTSQSAS